MSKMLYRSMTRVKEELSALGYGCISENWNAQKSLYNYLLRRAPNVRKRGAGEVYRLRVREPLVRITSPSGEN